MQIWSYRYADNSGTDPEYPWPPVALPFLPLIQDQYADNEPHRPALGALFQRCQGHPPDYLLLADLGDLAKTEVEVLQVLDRLQALQVKPLVLPKTPEPVKDLQLYAPQMASLNQGPDPLSLVPLSSSDYFCLGMHCRQGEHQKKLQLGHHRNRLQGRPPPGKPPFGYRRGKQRYLIDRRTAPIVKAFYEHFLLYGSLRGAVRFLCQSWGKRISASTGQRWLTHPVYRGHLQYRTGQILANTHPPLLSGLQAAQVDRILRRNHFLPARSASAPRSLAGLVYCAECGSRLTVSRVTQPRKAKTYLYLQPQGCERQPKCSALSYGQVLEHTIAQICQQLPEAVQTLQIPALDDRKAQLQQDMERKRWLLGQVAELETTDILDEATAQQRTLTLKTEMAELEQQIAALPPVNLLETSQAIALPEFWLDLSESERRFYLREFLRAIYIHRRSASWEVQLEFVFQPAQRPEP
ncbi:recombinase family protein [Lyngbya confervoides]|uniref:Recombinase family protein n=1 Tax=Lyngbya confervoides BDU141951 TaxID=1574623 RepID=A0ABD4T214_9CYAN|nr:recombinase family protein [Lyngbya confervoides]MCM1982302.1 recombinase family protein [Lyngbya confervoides BDU141951]